MDRSQELERAVRYFTEESGIMDSMAVAAGQGSVLLRAEGGRETGPDTLYDLASVTKLFTGICCLRLRDEGRLRLSGRITEYEPRFVHLSAVTVEQLLGFQLQIRTAGRVDAAKTRGEALARLFGSEVVPQAGTEGGIQSIHHTPGHVIRRFYSDIPAMILKYVIEGASGMPFYECLRELILMPAGMQETWARVPDHRRKDCLLYGPEYRVEKERFIRRDPAARGIPHDPKAAVLQRDTGDLCGHAGLYSTVEDMIRFCRALLQGRILPPASLAELAVNRTGRQLPDGSYTQFLGYQCYVKHPDQFFSEIPLSMSPSAFGIGGFTGNHVSVDPGTDRFTLYLGNRVRNRLTMLLPEEDRDFASYGLRGDGSGIITWPDGTRHFSSVNYVHQKDSRLHAAIDRALRTCKT